MSTLPFNPLSRRPQRRRLVLAVRGAAGSGKSHFAASLANAGLGRLCLFDTERKARLLAGSDGSAFDALEIEHPDELPAFIDWALGPQGQEQGYGCFALDSWALYFGRKHRALLEAVRARTGDPTAQPTADELRTDQIVLQEVLRRLCTDSGACVVITDQIAARGQEEREENEMGRVLPMTASGLEYFVDVMIELDVRVDGFDTLRVGRVVKSNAPTLPVGTEIENPTFADFLNRLGEGPSPAALPEPSVTAEAVLDSDEDAVPAGTSAADLLALAESFGVEASAVRLAARHYCGSADLAHLSPEQRAELAARMTARYALAPSASQWHTRATAPRPPPRRSRSRRARKRPSGSLHQVTSSVRPPRPSPTPLAFLRRAGAGGAVRKRRADERLDARHFREVDLARSVPADAAVGRDEKRLELGLFLDAELLSQVAFVHVKRNGARLRLVVVRLHAHPGVEKAAEHTEPLSDHRQFVDAELPRRPLRDALGQRHPVVGDLGARFFERDEHQIPRTPEVGG